MRILIAVPLLIVAAACDVDRDATNDTTTVQLDEGEAQNIAEDVGNTAQEVGGAIANGAEDAANAVRNTDVDVDVNTNGGDASANNQ